MNEWIGDGIITMMDVGTTLITTMSDANRHATASKRNIIWTQSILHKKSIHKKGWKRNETKQKTLKKLGI